MTFFTFSWGKNYIAIRGLLRVLGHELDTPPVMSDRAIDLGVRESPAFLCYSGKAVIGQLLEQLEMGRRNFLYMSSFGPEACRCGGTGPYLEELASSKYPNIRSARLGGNSAEESRDAMRAAFPGTSNRLHDRAFFVYFVKMGILDAFERGGVRARALGANVGRIERIERESVERLDRAQFVPALFWIGAVHGFRLCALRKKRRAPILRIGLVGGEHILSELDSIMARIKRTAERGILLDWRSGFFHINRMADREHPEGGKMARGYLEAQCEPYLHPAPGGTEILTCARAVEFAKEGYDGIMHIYSFGCLPQTAVIPAVKRIGKDYGIPILSISIGDRFDMQSLETRIDAFLDILHAKKRQEGAR